MNTFRLINKIEKSIINNSLLNLSSKILLYIKQNNCRLFIFVKDEKSIINFPSIFLVSGENSIILEEKLKIENVHSAGVYFGFIKKGVFHLSLEGAEVLLKNNLIPDQNIFEVNKEGEKSILYGNPILKRMILNTSSNLHKNALMLVLNESKELIGLALSEINNFENKLLNNGDLAATNLTDKGYYLRSKQ